MKTLFCLLAFSLAAPIYAGALDERPGQRWAINGRILQVIDDGVLVSCDKTNRIGMPQPEDGSIVFVRGKFDGFVDADRVMIVGELAGTFQYGSVSGAKKTVRAYDLVTVTRARAPRARSLRLWR